MHNLQNTYFFYNKVYVCEVPKLKILFPYLDAVFIAFQESRGHLHISFVVRLNNKRQALPDATVPLTHSEFRRKNDAAGQRRVPAKIACRVCVRAFIYNEPKQNFIGGRTNL